VFPPRFEPGRWRLTVLGDPMPAVKQIKTVWRTKPGSTNECCRAVATGTGPRVDQTIREAFERAGAGASI